ncbi:MAG: recombinase family protein [Clostridiales bacterium]|nr:recombinase family protein [Clostridiales bacterium]
MSNVYGYVKDSDNQSVDTQIQAMRDYGVENSCIYKDERNDFSAWQLLLGKVRPGDTVVLKSLDQLGDSYEAIIGEWEKLTKEHDAAAVVLDMPLPDTAKALNGQFVSELVLDVLNYVEQNRKVLRRRKQKAAIRAAQEKGVKFGSPSKLIPEEFEKVKTEYERGDLTVTAAAKQLDISRATFRRWVKKEGM